MNGSKTRASARSFRVATSLLVAVVAAGGCLRAGPARPPDVILIVLDTTRPDRLSPYGYGKDTTPNLDALAEESIVFERAYATSTWTLASHASLFTGLLPMTHRATQSNLRLDDELDTLAELLRRAGYETAAFTNNSWISQVTMLSRGFDKLEPMWRDRRKRPADGLPHPTNELLGEWLSARDSERPLFLFINYMEPHWPFSPPEKFRERFVPADTSAQVLKRSNFPAISWYLGNRNPGQKVLETRSALYDAEVAYLDAALGELFASLDDVGLFGDALVIVTSDHGENLGERGHQGHSFTLYDTTVRVPLLIRAPGGADGGTRRQEPVHLPDLFVTIARAAGIDRFDERVVGIDLLAETPPADRAIIAEYDFPKTFLGRFPDTEAARTASAPYRRVIRSIRIGPDKLIWGSDGRNELYDLDSDPEETKNLVDVEIERARALELTLTETLEELSRPITQAQGPVSEMDEDTIANLRALGYLP